MSNAMDVLDNLIREELPRVRYESLPQIAPIFANIEESSIDVMRSTDIGRGWKVLHLFATGVAGLVQYGNPLGPGMTSFTGGNLSALAQGTAATDLAIFPNAHRSPHTGTLKRELSLHMMTGNFSIPPTWMQADALNASQIKQVTNDIVAVGQLHSMIEATSLFGYTASDGTYDVDVLGRISAIAENSGTADYIDITLDEAYGRIHNFRIGMVVDIVASSGGNIQTGVATDGTDVRNYTHTGAAYVLLYVHSVDYLNSKITLAPVNSVSGAKPNYGSGTSGDVFQAGYAGAADDWITLAGCTVNTAGRPMRTNGLEDWIKSSGTILGGATGASCLDLDVYPQFKSEVVAVNGPLTDVVMNNYVGKFMDSYPGNTIDTILTTQGVTLKYLEQPEMSNNRFVYDRAGKALNVQGGWSKVGYEFNGRTMSWQISPMCLKKHVYGLKMAGGNLKKYVPPKIGGTDGRVSSNIEFLAPLGGHSGIFKIVHDSSGNSENLLEAPFWEYLLIAPIDPKGIKLTGVSENL